MDTARVLTLLERAEQLVAGAAVVGPFTRESVGVARRAYAMLQAARTDQEAARWLFVLGSRALAAAADMHLGLLDTTPRNGALPTTLLELAAAASEVDAPPVAPGLMGGRLGMSFGLNAPALARGAPAIVTERQDPVAPPARIGPLPAIELPAQPRAEPPALPNAELPITQNEPEPIVPEASTIDLVPIALCASIAASIARTTERGAAILESHQLDGASWTEVELHWAEEIRQDLKRGKTALLAEYDEAYVAQLETERGAITVDEYARIVVATERGTQEQTLGEMGLPQGVTIRLQRVWLKKTLQDKTLARRLREAIRACN